jgi:hypothetical protein
MIIEIDTEEIMRKNPGLLIRDILYPIRTKILQILRKHKYDRIVTNGKINAFLSDFSNFNISPISKILLQTNNIYLSGTFFGVDVYVDSKMNWNDCRILFLDKNIDRLKKINRAIGLENKIDEIVLIIKDSNNYLI